MYPPEVIMIPYMLIDDEEVQPMDERIYGIIYWLAKMSGKRCTASNEMIAKYAKTSPKTVGNSLLILERQGYVARTFTDKTKRHRKEIIPLVGMRKGDTPTGGSKDVIHPQVDLDPPTGGTLIHPQVDRKEIGKESVKRNNVSRHVDKSMGEKEVFGNPDINRVLADFEQVMGYPSQGRVKMDRYAAKNLLGKFTSEQIRGMLEYCANGRYAPRVGSVEKLWLKRGEVLAGWRKEASDSKVINVADYLSKKQ